MTKARRIAALILSLIMVLSLCVMFASCVNEEELQQKQQRIDELQAQLEGKQKEIEDLKAQLESKQKELDELQRENETSTFQLNNAKKDIKNLVGQLSELVTPDLETLSESDENIIKHYVEPTLEDDFKDNIVKLIIKSNFIGLIGFKDFAVTKSVSEVIAITCGQETIYKGSNETFPFYEGHNKGITLTLSTHDKAKVLEVADILRNLDMVLIADTDYNYIVVPFSIPSDTYYSEQWGLNGNNGINIEDAWNYTKGDYSVKVGVMEGNFDGHEDLGNMFNANITEWSTDGGEAQDRINHGTHVAGIIGANMDNNRGIAGVAKCSMYMLNAGDLIGSLKYAAENGIKVINASFGFYKKINDTLIPLPYNKDYYDAIEEYGKSGGLLICAAGNDGRSNDYTPVYPASYDLPNVISVGAIDSDGYISSFSNYGKQSVDIFAPGEQILSTYPQYLCTDEYIQTRWGEFPACDCIWTNQLNENKEYEWVPTESHRAKGYHYMSGTSMAAPFVTGVAALLLANNPGMSAFDIKYTIMYNVDESSKLSNSCVSGGRLNAYKALSNPHVNHSYVVDFEFIDNASHQETCLCGAVTIKPHQYTRFRYIDGRYHKAICNCGKTVTDMHVVKEGTGVLKKCLLCHAQVDTGITIFPNTLSVLPATDNGSYILPNGIIVLVEEDVEAYFNGELVFSVNRNQSAA